MKPEPLRPPRDPETRQVLGQLRFDSMFKCDQVDLDAPVYQTLDVGQHLRGPDGARKRVHRQVGDGQIAGVRGAIHHRDSNSLSQRWARDSSEYVFRAVS